MHESMDWPRLQPPPRRHRRRLFLIILWHAGFNRAQVTDRIGEELKSPTPSRQAEVSSVWAAAGGACQYHQNPGASTLTSVEFAALTIIALDSSSSMGDIIRGGTASDRSIRALVPSATGSSGQGTHPGAHRQVGTRQSRRRQAGLRGRFRAADRLRAGISDLFRAAWRPIDRAARRRRQGKSGS